MIVSSRAILSTALQRDAEATEVDNSAVSPRKNSGASGTTVEEEKADKALFSYLNPGPVVPPLARVDLSQKGRAVNSVRHGQ